MCVAQFASLVASELSIEQLYEQFDGFATPTSILPLDTAPTGTTIHGYLHTPTPPSLLYCTTTPTALLLSPSLSRLSLATALPYSAIKRITPTETDREFTIELYTGSAVTLRTIESEAFKTWMDELTTHVFEAGAPPPPPPQPETERDPATPLTDTECLAIVQATTRDDLSLFTATAGNSTTLHTISDGVGCNLLHLACQHNAVNILTHLLTYNVVDPTVVNQANEAPLRTGVRFQARECVRVLLEMVYLDEYRVVPMGCVHHAASLGDDRMVEDLLSAGAGAVGLDEMDRSALHAVAGGGGDGGEGSLGSLLLLLDLGAEEVIDVRDAIAGDTALHLAVR